MANPPPAVRLALESICLLMGEGTPDWKGIRQVTMRDNFIPTIVNFNTDDISDEVRIQMKKKYLDNPDYDYEKASNTRNMVTVGHRDFFDISVPGFFLKF